MMQTIRLRGVDPLLFRDGRPFTNELGAQRADSLPVPLPGVVAGAVRSAIGRQSGWDWKAAGPANAQAVAVHGPLVCIGDGKPVVAAPADAIIYKNDNEKNNPLQCACLRPMRRLPEGAGCNIPEGAAPIEVTIDEKPESGFRFWLWGDVMRWLADPQGKGFDPLPGDFCNIGCPAMEERTHVMIGKNGIAEEHMLFTTSSVVPLERRRQDSKAIERDWSYLAGVSDDTDISGPLFLGGERRVAVAAQAAPTDWPACPPDLEAALRHSARIRMLLVTPAIFSGGWRPGWEGGSPPGTSDLKLTLKAACLQRREAVSGWDYAAIIPGSERRGAPKAVRWLAPAGSVFFFEAEGNTSQLATSAWLAPMSDDEQDRRDGYGLAVWGIWDYRGGNG